MSATAVIITTSGPHSPECSGQSELLGMEQVHLAGKVASWGRRWEAQVVAGGAALCSQWLHKSFCPHKIPKASRHFWLHPTHESQRG